MSVSSRCFRAQVTALFSVPGAQTSQANSSVPVVITNQASSGDTEQPSALYLGAFDREQTTMQHSSLLQAIAADPVDTASVDQAL